jgi:hypothetical protein
VRRAPAGGRAGGRLFVDVSGRRHVTFIMIMIMSASMISCSCHAQLQSVMMI